MKLACGVSVGNTESEVKRLLPQARQPIEGSAFQYSETGCLARIYLKDGRVEQGNFDAYRMMRMREMPKVEVVLAPTGGFWGGVGEPGQAPLIPAMVNAIYAATGKRIRSLPLKNQGFTLA